MSQFANGLELFGKGIGGARQRIEPGGSRLPARGLARAALRHGQIMGALKPKLLVLAQRSDVHIIDKVHIARCIKNINGEGVNDPDLEVFHSKP